MERLSQEMSRRQATAGMVAGKGFHSLFDQRRILPNMKRPNY
jgi:hypothetical protein